MHKLEVVNLVKTIKELEIVKGMSLDVSSGEVVGLLGPNGAGKTTLIKMLVGLHRKTSGMFKVAGTENISRIRRIIGYMSQKFSLYPDMTVYGFLSFIAEIRGFYGRAKKDKVEDVIERCFL